MRLRDRLTLQRDGQTVAESVPCYMAHKGGGRVNDHDPAVWRPAHYIETLSGLVKVSEARAEDMVNSPTSYGVVYRGRTYPVHAVNPRRRPDGTLHHVSLDLERVMG